MKIVSAKINGITNPLGYDFAQLVASWKVTDTQAAVQDSARLEVALDEAFSDVLKSVEGNIDSTGTLIEGLRLKPRTRYYWRVSVVGDNKETAVSGPAWFETGKVDEVWTGKWITSGFDEHPVFEKEITIDEEVTSARAYICGLGLFEAYIDGEKLGEEYLTPYLNDYETGCQVICFDITDKLAENAEKAALLQIALGKGWYMSDFGLNGGYNYGDKMCLVAEVHIDYADGSHQVIGTDTDWLCGKSDVSESGIYYGEDLDRRSGNRIGRRLKEAAPAALAEAPGRLLDRYSLPVVSKEILYPKEIIRTPKGETVIDFGQNHAGIMEFEADFPKKTIITIDCGEVLQDGCFYNENYRTARSRFVYISDGIRETARPHFTFFGYRYLRIQGWPGDIKPEDIWSHVVYSDMERTGYIKTGNDKINRLYENCVWGQKSNFIDIPTDCPQRDERLGWTGDAQVFSQTASLNMDTRAFYRKFLRDLAADAKRNNGAVASYIPNNASSIAGCASVWGDMATFTPYVLFKTFGSLDDIEEHYDMMRGWVEYMHGVDIMRGDRGMFLNFFQFGDWLALDGITDQSFKGATEDDYIGCCYYLRSTQILAEIAEKLAGKALVKDDAAYKKYALDAVSYKALAEKIRTAILDEYFAPSGRLTCDTQAAYILALAFDIYRDRDKLISQFTERLRKDCYEIRCGFVGAPLLCTTLAKIGREDLAYYFLFNEKFPSWLYCVNLGATTIWERWNSLLPDGRISGTGMNSFNHYSYGTVVQFLYEYTAGIKPLLPGYRKAEIRPLPTVRLKDFRCSLNAAAGNYVSEWHIASDGRLTLHFEVPYSASATVTLPKYPSGAEAELEKNGLTVSADELGLDEMTGVCELAAGSYDFSYMPSEDLRMPYGPTTRLIELEQDEEARNLLKENLPVAYGMLASGDRENLNLTFEEMKYMGFLGFDADAVEKTKQKIYSLIRY